jgi:uncharacterized protein (TIGR04206 family)
MVWVRSEYAGALSVISAWLCALIPWNITYSSDVAGGSLLFVRFPLFQVRYAWGIDIAQRVSISNPLTALSLQAGQSIAVAYQAWVIGAAVMVVAVLFSFVYYAREQEVETGPIDPVRLMGGLLGGTGVILGVATYLLVTRGFPGIPLPLGVIVLLVLSGVLLTVERTE